MHAGTIGIDNGVNLGNKPPVCPNRPQIVPGPTPATTQTITTLTDPVAEIDRHQPYDTASQAEEELTRDQELVILGTELNKGGEYQDGGQVVVDATQGCTAAGKGGTQGEIEEYYQQGATRTQVLVTGG